jgi:hypothetical protein
LEEGHLAPNRYGTATEKYWAQLENAHCGAANAALTLSIDIMSVISVRSCLSKPAFWVLTGTIMIPLNLILAAVFWALAKSGYSEKRAHAARCFNVQLTYTLVFFLPILLAERFSTPAFHTLFPGGAAQTMIVGLSFGIIGLSGVIILIFSNTRMFAGEVLGHETPAPPRFRFVTE